jgi:hypothetical protein
MLSRHRLVAIVALAIAVSGCDGKNTSASVNTTSTQTTENYVVVNDTAGNGAVANETAANTTGGVPTGGTCGGIANAQCGDTADYCKHPAGQCDGHVADGAGTCTKKPELCPQDVKPVCGCDHKTYSNACAAAQAGASVLSEGACPKQ